MRRLVIALGATLSGLVLLFSWPTSTNRPVDATDPGSATDPGGATGATASAGSGASGSPETTSSSGTTGDGTYQGVSVGTQRGNVQVEITVAGGVITGATAIDYPHQNGEDQQINAYAIPILQDETLAAQSASIDMVSGATVTSGGYIESLQDALDQAGL
jgi:uncharacterized protein with FMN-binding domain